MIKNDLGLRKLSWKYEFSCRNKPLSAKSYQILYASLKTSFSALFNQLIKEIVKKTPFHFNSTVIWLGMLSDKNFFWIYFYSFWDWLTFLIFEKILINSKDKMGIAPRKWKFWIFLVKSISYIYLISAFWSAWFISTWWYYLPNWERK